MGTSPAFDVSQVWSHRFPSAELVDAAASMFTGHRVPLREVRVAVGGRIVPERVRPVLTDVQRQELRDWMRSHGYEPDTIPESELQGSFFCSPPAPEPLVRLDTEAARTVTDSETVEGPRWRITVSPGTVSVRYSDPVRADRTRERALAVQLGRFRRNAARLAVGLEVEPDPEPRGSCISSWSKRSRSRMVEVLAQLDWSGMFTTDELPAMVTLTYPGDWLAVAPHAAAARRHLLLLRKRFARAWGRPLVGVWKREFQRRGAPHWHLLMVPPHGQVNGESFREWLSRTWADIVGAECCTTSDPCDSGARCEYHAHRLAGTGVDYAEGVKARDPRSIGVYFSKHGAFASKDYQNEAPAEWVEAGSVGRFWGVWGLDKSLAAVEVAPAEATAARRTLRRYSRANSYVTRVPVWRYRTRVDPDTGEVRAKWRKSTKLARVYRVRHQAGYLVVRDGPALAGALARHLDQLYRPDQVVSRSGAGPVGFLP